MLTSVLMIGALTVLASPGSGVERRAHTTDLEKLSEWIDLEKSFTDERRAEARRAIATHLKEATAFTEAGFYLELRRIVALADNGHSNVDDGPIQGEFGLLPLRAYRFADGLFVVRALEAHRTLLGARLVAVDGRSLEDLEAHLMSYAGGTLEYFRHYTEPQLLLCPALLHAAGLAESPDRLRLTLEDREGVTLERILAVDPESSGLRARPWRYLSPAPIADGWIAFHAPETEPTLWLQDEQKGFRYLHVADDVVYFQLRANRDQAGQRIRDFARETCARLTEDAPRSIVLDTRQNGGGDLTTTADFALELPSYVRPGGRVYVLTGNGTFSAGIYTSFYPKASDPENTLVVGEPVGDRAEFWAETGAPFLLPESGYGIGYALQRHDLVHGCAVPGECHMAQHPEHWNLAVASLEPDHPVPTTFADFAAGRDPVLDFVLAHAAQGH